MAWLKLKARNDYNNAVLYRYLVVQSFLPDGYSASQPHQTS